MQVDYTYIYQYDVFVQNVLACLIFLRQLIGNQICFFSFIQYMTFSVVLDHYRGPSTLAGLTIICIMIPVTKSVAKVRLLSLSYAQPCGQISASSVEILTKVFLSSLRRCSTWVGCRKVLWSAKMAELT